MKALSLALGVLLLSACQAHHTVDKDNFYFGQVIEKDEVLLWQDCISGKTRPVKGVKEASKGPMSVVANSSTDASSTLRVTTIIGEESQGSCQEHANAELTNTLWELVHWPNTKAPQAGELKLLITDSHTLRGNWRCHEFTGDALVNEGKVSWPLITWSANSCDANAKVLGDLPASFQGPWRSAIYGDTLVLTSPQGEKAFFRALYL